MGKVVPLHTQQCPLPSREVSYPPPKCPPPSSPPRHIYQNVLPPVPPRVPLHPPPSTAPSPTTPPHILLMRKDAALQVELLSLPESKLTTGASFLKPWFSTPPSLPLPRPAAELEAILASSQRQLEESGWYYGQLTWQESAHLLQDSPP